MPEKKVTAATLTGAIATILVWVLKLAGIDIPGELATAITTVLIAITGYLAPHTQRPDLARTPSEARTASEAG